MSERESPQLRVADEQTCLVCRFVVLFNSLIPFHSLAGLAFRRCRIRGWLYHVVITAITGKRLPSSSRPEGPSLDDDFPFKRARMDDGQQPHTPPSSKARIEPTMPQAKSMLCTPSTSIYKHSLTATPPRLNREETGTNLNAAFKPFKGYIEWLAEGKLDGYLDSIRCEDKTKVPDVDISNNLSLLLHDVGKFPDEERIKKLFINDTVFVAPTSLAWRLLTMLAAFSSIPLAPGKPN